MTVQSEICPVHGEPFIAPDCPDGFRRCTFYIPELGASEDYGCPQPRDGGEDVTTREDRAVIERDPRWPADAPTDHLETVEYWRELYGLAVEEGQHQIELRNRYLDDVAMLKAALLDFFKFVTVNLDPDPSPCVDHYLTWPADRAGQLRALLGQVQGEEPVPGLVGADPLAPDSLARPTGQQPGPLGPEGTA